MADASMSNGSHADPSAVEPRRYFDGDEERYRKAQIQAEADESTIAQWMRWLKIGLGVSVAVSLMLLGLVVFYSTRATAEVKFVVQNAEGQFQILGWDAYQPEEGVLKRDLEWWLRCARSVTTDVDTHTRCWTRIPMFIKAKSQCAQEVQTYVQQRQPEGLLFHKSVVMHDLQGSREPDGRWRFSWVERTYQLDHGRSGALLDTSTWHAILMTTRERPTTAKQIEHERETINPLGLLCTQLAWWR